MSQSQERLTIREDGLTRNILECWNGFEHQDYLINEEVNETPCGHNGWVFLSQSEVSIPIRVDFLLDKISWFFEACHYIGGCVENDNLENIYFKENVTSLDGISRHHLFQLENGNHLKEDVQKYWEREQVYDMKWLFGKKCLVNIFIRAFSSRSSIEEVSGR